MEQTNSTNNAGFIRRSFAVIIDNLLFTVLFTLTLMLVMSISKINVSIFVAGMNAFASILMIIAIGQLVKIAYHVFFTSKFGGTIGKLVVGTRVVDMDTNQYIDAKTAFYRFTAGYAFSGALLGAGFFRIIKNSDNLAWHDELFNTRVKVTGKAGWGCLTWVGLMVLLGVSVFMLVGYLGTNVFPAIGLKAPGTYLNTKNVEQIAQLTPSTSETDTETNKQLEWNTYKSD